MTAITGTGPGLVNGPARLRYLPKPVTASAKITHLVAWRALIMLTRNEAVKNGASVQVRPADGLPLLKAINMDLPFG
jgi:hypothetical protein